MTDKMLLRRLSAEDLNGIDQVVLPGRCRGDLDVLNAHFKIDFVRDHAVMLALGAMRASSWLVNQAVGMFDMQDVLDLRD